MSYLLAHWFARFNATRSCLVETTRDAASGTPDSTIFARDSGQAAELCGTGSSRDSHAQLSEGGVSSPLHLQHVCAQQRNAWVVFYAHHAHVLYAHAK